MHAQFWKNSNSLVGTQCTLGLNVYKVRSGVYIVYNNQIIVEWINRRRLDRESQLREMPLHYKTVLPALNPTCIDHF